MGKYPGDDGRYNEPSTKKDARQVLAGEKSLKSEVHYRPQSEDSEKVCFECINYCNRGEPQGECDKVVGLVTAGWVCDLWQQAPPDADGDNDGDEKSPIVQVLINLGQGRQGTT